MKNVFSIIGVSMFLMMCLTSYSQNDTAYIFTYGGTGQDHCRKIEPTSDGGFILAGATGSFGNGSSDIYLVKIDSNCIHQWSKAIGGTNVEWGYSVKQTFDGGFIIAGYTNSFGAGGYDVYLVKTDSLGETLWTKTYGGSDWDFGYSVQITPDSGFVICGETYSFGNGNADVYIIRTNSIGDTLWTHAFGGTGKDIGHSIIISNDSNYVVVGETSSFGLDSSDVYLLKIDQAGDTVWTKRYGNTGIEVGYSLDQTIDSGFVIVGFTTSYGSGMKDDYFFKVNLLGIFQWDIVMGGPEEDEFRDIKQLPDSGYIIIGSTNSYGLGDYGMRILRADANLNFPAGPTFGDIDIEKGYSLTIVNNGSVVFAGITKSYGQGNEDIYLVKVKSDSLVSNYTLQIIEFGDSLPNYTSFNQIFNNSEKITIYPNPFNEFTSINIQSETLNKKDLKFTVFNILGEKVFQINNIKKSYIEFNRGALNPGMYIFILSVNNSPISKGKLVVD